MDLIANKKQIIKVLRNLDMPSILRLDESYFKDADLIHCVVQFETLSIYAMEELMDISIDQTLIDLTGYILIAITSNTDLKKCEIEAITNIISSKTEFKEYHINWRIDFDYELDHFGLLLIFVE